MQRIVVRVTPPGELRHRKGDWHDGADSTNRNSAYQIRLRVDATPVAGTVVTALARTWIMQKANRQIDEGNGTSAEMFRCGSYSVAECADYLEVDLLGLANGALRVFVLRLLFRLPSDARQRCTESSSGRWSTPTQ
jgi:hypothetical protein